ncbi:MAG TPA: histidine--tRNA ligase [Tepidisphaeraceae bacterium]|nr:histidine--tRNA ligase [Tepidisphaeraceae bacterium]
MNIAAPKGTVDILPAESWKWQAIEAIARQVAELYHFSEIRTPIFEHSELFHRGVGETSDIVHKETYTFDDRGGRSITLRPEQTAGVVRAMIESNLLADAGARAKVFYIGPNFRYENVQKGRLRQHHQFGVEAFGVAVPEQDVECILLQMDFYRRCGIKDLALRLNSLGDGESKYQYGQSLKNHLQPKLAQLSNDSQRRWATNPLRILDSKDPRDIEACHGAPSALDYLSERSRKHFDRVLGFLAGLGMANYLKIDPTLVRGFDYYTDTLWEVTTSGLGSQNALGGGGRYDNLIETLGGKPTPGVGFGSGIERLLIALEAQGAAIPNSQKPLIWLVSQNDAARDYNFILIAELRAAGIACDMDLTGRKQDKQMKLANREHATWCIIVGETELTSNSVMLKNLSTGEQLPVGRSEIVQRLKDAK